MLKSVLLFLLLGVAVYEVISVAVILIRKAKAKRNNKKNIEK